MAKNLTINIANDSKPLPLTVPIQDESRAMLAYNMLAYMAENKTTFQVAGENFNITRDQLQILDENGTIIEPVTDLEWFGTKIDNEAVKAAALEKDKNKAYAAGEGDYWDDEFEAELQEPYTVNSYDMEDHTRVWFAPKTWDIDKAVDMNNMMHYAIDGNVTMKFERDPSYHDDKPVEINMNHVCVSNMDGDVLSASDEVNPNWANEVVEDSDVTLTADDLAGIDAVNNMTL